MNRCFAYACVLIASGWLAACDEAPDHETNYSVVWGGGYGYIDESGTQVVRKDYAYATEFSEGLGGVNVGGAFHGKNWPTNGKWGFVDLNNFLVINPKYDSPQKNSYAPYSLNDLSLYLHDGYVFSHGLAPVYLKSHTEPSKGRWVFINRGDQTVIREVRVEGEGDTPDQTYPILSARRFSEGLAAVYANGKWGYLDTLGRLVIPLKYRLADNFRDGYAIVRDENLRQVCIDRKGNRVFSQYRMESGFWEGVASVKLPLKGIPGKYDDEFKLGLMDTTGTLLCEPQFDRIGRFGSNRAPVLVGSRPDSVQERPEGLEVTESKGGKWGYINRYGHFLINPIYDEAKGFSHGLAAVRIGWEWGYIDTLGNLVYQPQFLYAGYFREEIAQVKLGNSYNTYGGKQAYINKEGDVIWIAP